MKYFMAGLVLIVACLCITVLELYALYLGHNGFMLLSVVGALALVVGVKGKEIVNLVKMEKMDKDRG